MHNLNPIVTAALGGKGATPGKPINIKGQSQHGLPSPASAATTGPGSRMSPPGFQSPASNMGRQDSLQSRSASDDNYRRGSDAKPFDMQAQSSGNFAPPPRPAPLNNYSGGRNSLQGSPHIGNGDFQRPELRAQTSNVSSYGSSSPYNSAVTPSQSHPPSAASTCYQSPASGFQSQQNFPPFASLPPPEYPPSTGTPASRDQENQFYNGTSGQTPMNGVESTAHLDSRINGVTDAIMDQNPAYAIPMFGGDGYSRSPFAMADDFAAWLFNDNQFGPGGASPLSYPGGVKIGGRRTGESSRHRATQPPLFTPETRTVSPIATHDIRRPALWP